MLKVYTVRLGPGYPSLGLLRILVLFVLALNSSFDSRLQYRMHMQ